VVWLLLRLDLLHVMGSFLCLVGTRNDRHELRVRDWRDHSGTFHSVTNLVEY
jgi:hypothetical protein